MCLKQPMQSSKINETGSKQPHINRNKGENEKFEKGGACKIKKTAKPKGELKLKKKRKREKKVEVYSSQLSRSRFCHHLAGLACDLGKASSLATRMPRATQEKKEYGL